MHPGTAIVLQHSGRAYTNGQHRCQAMLDSSPVHHRGHAPRSLRPGPAASSGAVPPAGPGVVTAYGEQERPGPAHRPVYHPGETVPASGIYECDGQGCDHQWSTNVKGHTFPPMRDGCAGQGWRMKSETPTG